MVECGGEVNQVKRCGETVLSAAEQTQTRKGQSDLCPGKWQNNQKGLVRLIRNQ